MATVLKRSKTVVEKDGAGSASSRQQEGIRAVSNSLGGRMADWGNPYFGGNGEIEVDPVAIADQGVAVYRRPGYDDLVDFTGGKVCAGWIISGYYGIDIMPANTNKWECFSSYGGLSEDEKMVVAHRLVSTNGFPGTGHYVFIRPNSAPRDPSPLSYRAER